MWGMGSVQGNTNNGSVNRTHGGGGEREGAASGRGLSVYVNNTASSRAGSAGSSNQMSTTSQNSSQNSSQVLSPQDPGFVNESHDWALEGASMLGTCARVRAWVCLCRVRGLVPGCGCVVCANMVAMFHLFYE